MSKSAFTKIMRGLREALVVARGEMSNARIWSFLNSKGPHGETISVRVRTTLPNGDAVRLFVFWDQHAWVAQALDRDICAQGKSISAAMHHLEVAWTIKKELYPEAFKALPAAPKEFFDRWNALGEFA